MPCRATLIATIARMVERAAVCVTGEPQKLDASADSLSAQQATLHAIKRDLAYIASSHSLPLLLTCTACLRLVRSPISPRYAKLSSSMPMPSTCDTDRGMSNTAGNQQAVQSTHTLRRQSSYFPMQCRVMPGLHC